MNSYLSARSFIVYFCVAIPTLCTLLRIVTIPYISGFILQQDFSSAFWLFLGAALTDTLDGTLARFFGFQTWWGAFLDPIADKLLLVSCFCTFAMLQSPAFYIPEWFVILVIIKEFLLLLGCLAMYFTVGSLQVKPTWLGKTATFVQIVFVVWLFVCYFFGWFPATIYSLLLGIMTLTTVGSLMHYVYIGLNQLNKS